MLPENLPAIPSWLFSKCRNLKKVSVPDSVTKVGTDPFEKTDKVVIYASSDSYIFHYAEDKGLRALDVPLAKAGQYADGTPKELVTAGKATGGTLVYALGDSAEKEPKADAYSETVPAVVKANDYYVWYKMTGAERQDLTDPECIPVKILGKADRIRKQINALPGSITLRHKPMVDAAVATWRKLTKQEKTCLSEKEIKKLVAADDAIYQSIAKNRTTKINGARKKKGKEALIQWTKTAGASGYKIRYSTDKNLAKGVKTKKTSASATKVTLKNLKKGKKYYVQAIPYTTVKNRVTGVTKEINGKKSNVKKL